MYKKNSQNTREWLYQVSRRDSVVILSFNICTVENAQQNTLGIVVYRSLMQNCIPLTDRPERTTKTKLIQFKNENRNQKEKRKNNSNPISTQFGSKKFVLDAYVSPCVDKFSEHVVVKCCGMNAGSRTTEMFVWINPTCTQQSSDFCQIFF